MPVPRTLYLLSLTVFAALLLSDCAPTRQDYLTKTLLLPLDPAIFMATVWGFRVGMTPRKVAMIVEEYGFEESVDNVFTLEDLIVRNDLKPLSPGYISLDKGKGTLSFEDDVSIFLNFGCGVVISVTLTEFIPENSLSKYREADMNLFPQMKIEKGEDHILLVGKYRPNKYMGAIVSFIDRGYKSQKVIEHNVMIVDQLGCLKKKPHLSLVILEPKRHRLPHPARLLTTNSIRGWFTVTQASDGRYVSKT